MDNKIFIKLFLQYPGIYVGIGFSAIFIIMNMVSGIIYTYRAIELR